ncbi:MAG: 6-phosphogluconolactonase [Armatimonadota bacterium]|nr:MAG: 6-phosphogluconolactonase [Armatimonadota bacterium]
MATIERRTNERVLRIADTAEELAHAVAESLADRMLQILQWQPRFSLVLSGGKTPRLLYHLLATEYRQRINWNRVHLFWSDDRYVPHDHPASNFRMVCEMLTDPLNLPLENIHPMPTDAPDPDDAARLYEAQLRHFFGGFPRFDFILLGMGADGHTASLFPGTSALQERKRWVAVGEAPVEPRVRLTLTLPVLNAAQAVHFLVADADKAETVRRILVENAPLPAALVLPDHGELVWWLDKDAASGI